MKNTMPIRLNWDDAPAFLAVARAGTLTGAAKALGTGIATVSRRIERLENRLGVPLFARHQSGYRLTDQGEALMPRAEALEEAMREFRAEAATEAQAVGHVRLATAENLANPVIIPGLAPLLVRHSGLSIEILTDVGTINLHRRDADLALRMVRPERGNVSVRRIGTLGFGLYGSPAYIAGRDTAPDAGRFDGDRFIGWSEQYGGLPAARWIERTLRGRIPAITTTTLSAQLSAATAGLGLAILPHFLAREAGLQPLPVELGLDQPIWLALHSDLSASMRVRVVADHLVAIIERNHQRLAGHQ
jgi:DNA-binding transcriptional LysR family regulator